jgi:hypothetical protein
MISSARWSSDCGEARPSTLLALRLNHQLEGRRLLHREIAGLRAVEDHANISRQLSVDGNPSFNDLIRAGEDGLRERQPERFGGLRRLGRFLASASGDHARAVTSRAFDGIGLVHAPAAKS